MSGSDSSKKMFAGRYRLDEVLGVGGMGEVHRAFDTRLERIVAIKRVRNSDSRELRPEFTARTLREARAAAALRHPNVISIFDVGDDEEGWPYIVLEFLEGRPLSKLLHGNAPLAERVRWLRDTASGLAAAHAAGLAHRDIKPENLMLCGDGTLKILDFGIARRAEGAGDPSLTAPGTAIGTPAYMSPEQARGEPVDAKSDQFSWGVTAYEVLTGALPWSHKDTVFALIAAVVSEEVRPPSTANPRVGPELDAVVIRALQKVPADRFPNCEAIVSALAEPAIWAEPAALATTEAVGVPSRAGHESRTRTVTDPPFPEVADPHALEAYRSALEHFRDSNWAAAHRELLHAVSLEPRFPAALLRLAITGRFDGGMTSDECRATFRRALDGRRTLASRDRALLHAFEPLLLSLPPSPTENVARLRQACEAFPADAEIHGLTASMMLGDDARTQLGCAERAGAIDPDYATAWVVAGIAHADLGDPDAALRALDRALEISPASVDMYIDRALVHARRGDAERVESDARQATSLDRTRYGIHLLASAQYAKGESFDTIRSTLRRNSESVSDDERPSVEAHDEALLAVLDGRLAAAAQIADEALQREARRDRAELRGPLVEVALRCALELRQEAKAEALAAEYLATRRQHGGSSHPSYDPMPLAIAVLERAGKASADQATRSRDEWAASSFGASGLLWGIAFEPGCQLAHVLDQAGRRLEQGLVMRFHSSPWHCTDAGRVLFALGRTDEAIALLRTAAGACVAVFDAFRHVYAQLWLARALAARGEVYDAAEQYRAVLSRWERTPEAASLRSARQELAALGL